MKIIFKKITEGRGRPPKFVQLDDESLVPYKDYIKDHPESAKTLNVEEKPKETQEISDNPVPPVKIYKEKGIVIPNTIQAETVYGTPVNIVNRFNEFATVIVKGKYQTVVALNSLKIPEGVTIPEKAQEPLDNPEEV